MSSLSAAIVRRIYLGVSDAMPDLDTLETSYRNVIVQRSVEVNPQVEDIALFAREFVEEVRRIESWMATGLLSVNVPFKVMEINLRRRDGSIMKSLP